MCPNPTAVQALTRAVAFTLEPEPEPHGEGASPQPARTYLLPTYCLPACLPEAAVSVLRDLSNRLRQRDPESRVEAAPDGDSGRFVINSVRYTGCFGGWGKWTATPMCSPCSAWCSRVSPPVHSTT